MVTTRFAPSPTGYLHLGHAYAALMAAAAAERGLFLLRMEDLDPTRCRMEFAEAIEQDLAWMGLTWPIPVLRQSARAAIYRAAMDRLWAEQLLYPCFCTRRQIEVEIAGAAQAPGGSNGPIYPGTCRQLPTHIRSERMERGEAYALRLDVARASARAGALLFNEHGQGPRGESGCMAVRPDELGDVVIGRRDGSAAYHLAVVVDDASQGVTLVTRGNDLFAATHVQRLLQSLLDLPVPEYAHHQLILDNSGAKLSKRSGSAALRELRQQGWDPAMIRHRIGLT